jgi:biopolymer transport protein ExbB/TolQ
MSEAAPSGPAPQRGAFLLCGLALGVLIVALGALLPTGSFAAIVLFDHREGATLPFPFTINCIEWLVFGIGAGELAHHFVRARGEGRQLKRRLLPEDEEVMFDARSLLPFTRTIKESATAPYRLQRLLLRSIWQFQSSRSVAQAAGIMDATLELCQHELDLRYNLSRYIAWALPTIGFIGTVWGLSRGLSGLAGSGLDPTQKEAFKAVLTHTTQDLGLAFNTTLIALMLSAVLVLAMQLIQEAEERALNDAGQYCIDHLINKLYVPRRQA